MGGNNDDNNNGKDDEEGDGMDMLDRLLKRGTVPDSPEQPPVPRRIPPTAAELPMSEEAARIAAARELSAYFNSIAHPDNPGVKKLRDDPRYKIANAVWNDDLGKYMAEMAMNNNPPLNRRWYWHFPQQPKNVAFLTPAHVVRTHLMAVAITRHRADFRAPDSEGCLPIYYIARYCTDPWLIPYLASAQKVDLRDSGRASNENNAHTGRGERYEEPILRAIRYANVYAVEGFIRSVHYGLDLNQSRLPHGQTPLMIAVQMANECAENYSGHGQGRQELLNRLNIVRDLVGETSVNLEIRDAAGNRAIDYATEKAVLGSWEAGLDDRTRNSHRPRPWGHEPKP